MKITILIENTGKAPLRAEHGLSLYISHPGGDILFDAGQSGVFLDNADQLGIPVWDVETAVLSHGHYDHGNGFLPLLQAKPNLKILARPGVLKGHRNPKGKYIGLCSTLTGEYSDRFDCQDGRRDLGTGLYLIPDDLYHEQSLVAEREDGSLVVVNSCCHAGVEAIIEGVLDEFPGRKVYALIGGLHLMGPDGVETLGQSEQTVVNLARFLTSELGVERIYTGHCTGIPAFDLLQQTCPENFFPLYTGMQLTF